MRRLIEEFQKLPGIGPRSAERLAFHVLRIPRQEAANLARAIRDAHVETLRCSRCGNVTENDPCPICSDPERESHCLLVVEDPRDVEAFEKAGVYRGLYHVLMGALNPSEGTEPRHLGLERLKARVAEESIREVVLGTDPDVEGDGTALLLVEILEGANVEVTRLARGLPVGTSIEHLNRAILHEALEGRRRVE